MLHVGVVRGAGLSAVDIAAVRLRHGGGNSAVAGPGRVNGELALPGR